MQNRPALGPGSQWLPFGRGSPEPYIPKWDCARVHKKGTVAVGGVVVKVEVVEVRRVLVVGAVMSVILVVLLLVGVVVLVVVSRDIQWKWYEELFVLEKIKERPPFAMPRSARPATLYLADFQMDTVVE